MAYGYTADLPAASRWESKSSKIAESTPVAVGNETLADLQKQLKGLKANLRVFQEQVRIHILENKKPTPFDFIQHRAGLHYLLAALDQLFIQTMDLERADKKEVEACRNFVSELDSIQQPLYADLMQWHGRPEEQKDIPDEIIQAFRDVNEGQVVDLDIALNDAPGEVH